MELIGFRKDQIIAPISTAANTALTLSSKSNSPLANIAGAKSFAEFLVYLITLDPLKKTQLMHKAHLTLAIAKALLFNFHVLQANPTGVVGRLACWHGHLNVGKRGNIFYHLRRN